MQIIIDTREQKPLSFTRHKTLRRKLEEGDYNTPDLVPYIVLERKSLADLYGSIIKGHDRFKREITRSRLQGKTFYIFIEGTIQEFMDLRWTNRPICTRPETLRRILDTMIERYQLIVIECRTRKIMAQKIIETLETNLNELYGR